MFIWNEVRDAYKLLEKILKSAKVWKVWSFKICSPNMIQSLDTLSNYSSFQTLHDGHDEKDKIV